MNYQLLNDKKYVISSNFIKVIDKTMTITEFFVLLYCLNNKDSSFDVNKISEDLNISIEDVMQAIEGLISKEYIALTQGKDNNGKITDKIELNGLYDKVLKDIKNSETKNEEKNIFQEIEEVFSRKLTRYESEIVNGWLDIGTPIELIQGALKEASYNGTLTFKYLDTIIYKWTSKGFKTMKDVEKYLKEKEELKDNTELFDYDWLDDDE